MPAINHIPAFSIRWTERNGSITKTQHVVDVDVNEHAGRQAPTGRIITTSSDELGPIPAGQKISDMTVIKTPETLAMASDLWKAVERSNIRQWVERSDAPGARLGGSDMEVVISRPGGKHEVYRASLDAPSQPIADIIAAAGKVIGDIRVGPRFSQ
jgi:hypothetical protein